MTQDPVVWAVAFLLIFVGLLYYFTGRITAGYVPALRRIRAFEALKGFTGRAIEAGRALHLSLGTGSVANETTADSLAGLSVLDYLAEQAAVTGVPPTVSMADPTVMLFAQNALRAAHADDPEEAEEAYRIGLLDRLVSSEHLMDEALKVANQIVSLPPMATQAARRVLQQSMELGFDQQLRNEYYHLIISRRAPHDMKEQRDSFWEKRPPKFTGK